MRKRQQVEITLHNGELRFTPVASAGAVFALDDRSTTRLPLLSTAVSIGTEAEAALQRSALLEPPRAPRQKLVTVSEIFDRELSPPMPVLTPPREHIEGVRIDIRKLESGYQFCPVAWTGEGLRIGRTRVMHARTARGLGLAIMRALVVSAVWGGKVRLEAAGARWLSERARKGSEQQQSDLWKGTRRR